MTNQELIFRMFVTEFMGWYQSEKYEYYCFESSELLYRVCDALREIPVNMCSDCNEREGDLVSPIFIKDTVYQCTECAEIKHERSIRG